MGTENTIDADLWLRRYHSAPRARIRLVCFPHAGGSASYYVPVSNALSPALDVVAVQYPGRQDRRGEPFVETVEELADILVDLIEPLADLPLALFGHSLGASIAFEVACRLESRGTVPLALFASGRRAPSRARDESVHLMDDQGLIAEIKQLGGTDAKLLGDQELMEMVLPATRNDYKAAELYRYTPRSPLATAIHAHIGVDDPKVSLDEAQAWKKHTTRAFELTTYPGGHFYLQDYGPRVIESIRRVTSELAELS
ncbi:thioesterase II family protein [Kitasatospora sp. NPDC086801]|uniref:thioesterase II family protein n=1 Tax=Kitasatospora sp. NPDC086801 TaxID=3364066 RepID=UPI00381E3251